MYKKALNNIDVFALKLHGGVTNEKLGHDLRLERVLDVFSNNGQCTLIEPLRVMTVIHCQSGNNSIKFEAQYKPRTVKRAKTNTQILVLIQVHCPERAGIQPDLSSRNAFQ